MVKIRAAFIAAGLLFLISTRGGFAEGKVELVDEDGDGRKESKIFYDDRGNKARGEVDLNGDGKPDRWVVFKNGVRYTAQDDKDFDGKVDHWSYYDEKGALKLSASDTNKDGKPDKWNLALKGRLLVQREYDRNFDGKIDRRALTAWGMIKYGPGQPATPGYITLWSEEDNDFDGKVDVYKEKGNKNPPKDRIGKPINPQPARMEPEKPKPAAESDGEKQEAPTQGKSVSPADERIKRLNERHGLA